MKVIVVGGGAAGMMAAIAAAKQGNQVELLEQNEKLGKKIYITGKGRCNVTNACDLDEFFANIVSNEKFLYSSMYQYDNQAVMDFFENSGCPLKTERGNRVFPVSDHASDITKALTEQMQALGVRITLRCRAADLMIKEDGSVGGVITEKKERKTADRVIFATGGLSYESTGSDGSGIRILEKYGHCVTAVKPALVPLELKEDYGVRLQGLSLKNVRFSIKNGKKKVYDGFGEMLFTHFGISGPLVISASSYYVKQMYGQEVKALIDLKPALTEDQLDRRILREFEENKKKQFKNTLDTLFPSKLIPVMIDLSGIDPEKKVHEITKEERKQFVNLIKNWEMTITGTRGFREAIITQGGVTVREVNPSTMESKVIPGLYLAGEMLDIDALTGGFNLQLAWSTGHLAGSSLQHETD